MADCSCIYVGDYEHAECYSNREVIARKEHKCCECGKKISPSQKYHYITGKWEGEWADYKMCNICDEISDTFFCDGVVFGRLLDDLWEHVFDVDGEIAGECLTGLSPAAREVVCELIEKCWREDDN